MFIPVLFKINTKIKKRNRPTARATSLPAVGHPSANQNKNKQKETNSLFSSKATSLPAVAYLGAIQKKDYHQKINSPSNTKSTSQPAVAYLSVSQTKDSKKTIANNLINLQITNTRPKGDKLKETSEYNFYSSTNETIFNDMHTNINEIHNLSNEIVGDKFIKSFF